MPPPPARGLGQMVLLSLFSIWAWMQLYLHSPIRLNGVVLNYVQG
jgi:hypothetical protein